MSDIQSECLDGLYLFGTTVSTFRLFFLTGKSTRIWIFGDSLSQTS